MQLGLLLRQILGLKAASPESKTAMLVILVMVRSLGLGSLLGLGMV
jgi:hypothetical protein